MKKYTGWLIFAVLAYGGWLLATLPLAPVLAAARNAGVPLQLSGVSGDLWSGQAARLAVRGLVLGEVRWEFAPSDLLRGRLAFDLEFRDAGGAAIARLAAGAGGVVEISGLSGRLEAARVAPLLPVSMELTGDLVFDDLSLHLRAGRPDAALGQLRWLQAAVQKPFPVNIGAMELVFQEAETGVQATYSGGSDAFTLQGNLTADADQGYRTDTLITPRNQEVRDWLQGMGLPRAGNGFRAIHAGAW